MTTTVLLDLNASDTSVWQRLNAQTMAYCNQGLTNICDVGSAPYTECFYCEDGECKPGCLEDGNCPQGYTCSDGDHMCRSPPGSVLLKSITITTKTPCSDCSDEGVTLSLFGKQNADFPNGVPCTANNLNNDGITDYDGGAARFDDLDTMGGCFEAPLKAILNGGTLMWLGGGTAWEPKTVCVEWKSDNFAHECDVESMGSGKWRLSNCHDITPSTVCT